MQQINTMSSPNFPLKQLKRTKNTLRSLKTTKNDHQHQIGTPVQVPSYRPQNKQFAMKTTSYLAQKTTINIKNNNLRQNHKFRKKWSISDRNGQFRTKTGNLGQKRAS